MEEEDMENFGSGPSSSPIPAEGRARERGRKDTHAVNVTSKVPLIDLAQAYSLLKASNYQVTTRGALLRLCVRIVSERYEEIAESTGGHKMSIQEATLVMDNCLPVLSYRGGERVSGKWADLRGEARFEAVQQEWLSRREYLKDVAVSVHREVEERARERGLISPTAVEGQSSSIARQGREEMLERARLAGHGDEAIAKGHSSGVAAHMSGGESEAGYASLAAHTSGVGGESGRESGGESEAGEGYEVDPVVSEEDLATIYMRAEMRSEKDREDRKAMEEWLRGMRDGR